MLWITCFFTKCDQTTFILRQPDTFTFANIHMAFYWYFWGECQLLWLCFKSVDLVCYPAGFWPLARSWCRQLRSSFCLLNICKGTLWKVAEWVMMLLLLSSSNPRHNALLDFTVLNTISSPELFYLLWCDDLFIKNSKDVNYLQVFRCPSKCECNYWESCFFVIFCFLFSAQWKSDSRCVVVVTIVPKQQQQISQFSHCHSWQFWGCNWTLFCFSFFSHHFTLLCYVMRSEQMRSDLRFWFVSKWSW